MSRSFVIVANQAAGTSSRAAVDVVRDVLRRSGDVVVHETQSIGELNTVVARLESRTLVVVGGDGSLHAAVSALYLAGIAQQATVGLIPLGTGNDLARTVGIPRDAEAAAEVVLRGEPQALDVLVEEKGQIALNAVHCGIGAEAVRLGSGVKRRIGAPGFAIGALMAGMRFPGWSIAVDVDGRRVPSHGRVLMVGVSIGHTIGGGAELAPAADPSDGAADVMVAATTGPWQRVKFARRLPKGGHIDLPEVEVDRGTQIRVTGDPIRANLDGEVTAPASEWSWSVAPKAWRLLTDQVPR